MKESGGFLLPGPLRAPPEDLNPPDFIPSALAPHYAAMAYSSAKLSFAVSLMARNGEPRRDKAYVFTRLSMLIGPSLPGDNPEGNWWSRRESHPGPVRLLRARLSP